MPAMNYEEEVVVLEETCRRIERTPDFIVQGVGIGTDSPKDYGLDTVVVEGPEDVPLVVDALGKKLRG